MRRVTKPLPLKCLNHALPALLAILCCLLLFACSDSSSPSVTSAETPAATDTETPAAVEAEINTLILESAASFLGAATGKEVPLTLEHVVFVNSVLGLNKVNRTPSCLFGDLWVIERDDYGVPIRDEQGCIQPIPAEPVPELNEFGVETGEYLDHVPMYFEEYIDGEPNCSVVEGYEEYTQEFLIERLNMVRSNVRNPDMMAMALAEAIRSINESVGVETDLAGRLVLEKEETVVDPDSGLASEVTTYSTIDSPRENLALYHALLAEGRIAGYGVETVGEEGEIIPAPWLEIRADLEMGDLVYLRDGTDGRSSGIGRHDGYADFSGVFHSTAGEYGGRMVDYVQYQAPDENGCVYSNQRDDSWLRVYGGEQYDDSNIRAFARHADDTRRMVSFMHWVIQDAPDDGVIADLPAHERVDVNVSDSHLDIPEIVPLDPSTATPVRHLQLETAAAMLAATAGKEIPLTRDAIMFVNSALGINDLPAGDMGEFFGDLWIILRDANGVPIKDEEFNCEQPIADPPIEIEVDGVPVVLETVPMMLEEYMDGKFKCAVVSGFEEYLQEVEMGRLNCVRTALTNPEVLNKQWVEAVHTLNSAVEIKRDLAGRLVYTVEYLDEEGETQLQDKAIDSPLQNLALYRALMTGGSLDGEVVVKVEGTPTLVVLELNPDLLTAHGLDYLAAGYDPPPPEPVLPIMASGYADFSSFSHSDVADYGEVTVDYVQWHDESEGGCTYTDETDDIHWRVLDSDEEQVSKLDAFLQQAEASREVILFNHRIIQDRPK